MHRLTKVLIGTASLTLLVAACDGALDREDQALIVKAGGSTGSSGYVSRTLDPDAMLGVKLGPYISCINSGSDRVSQSRSRYLMWVDRVKGPSCRERYIYAPYRLYSVLGCTTSLTRANAKSPKLPGLEKAASDFATAVLRLKPLLDEANTYYQTRAYKGDGCSKGKLLHPQLMAAFSAASGADTAMRERVAFHNGALQARRLAAIERAYGKNHPRYFHRKVIAVAKDTLHALQAQARQKSPDLTQIETKIKEYAAIVTQMEAAPGTGGAILYPSYKTAAKKLAQSYDEYLTRRKGGKPFSRFERRMLSGSAAWTVKGSAASVLRVYNDLVNSFNRVQFR